MIIATRFPYQNNYVIETNSTTFVSLCKAKYGKYVVEISNDKQVNCSVMENSFSFVVKFEGKSIETIRPLYEIDRLFFVNNQYDDQIFALHGAAVEYNHVAYLFLGPTTSGKTTLASYLVERGFGYLTDDCILLDKKELMVYPYTTPICLREGGLTVLRKLGMEPNGLHLLEEKGGVVRWVYTPSNRPDRPLPISRIFFISRNEDYNSIELMDKNERIKSLLESPIIPYELSTNYLQWIIQLSDIDITKLNYYNMEFVWETIRNGIK